MFQGFILVGFLCKFSFSFDLFLSHYMLCTVNKSYSSSVFYSFNTFPQSFSIYLFINIFSLWYYGQRKWHMYDFSPLEFVETSFMTQYVYTEGEKSEFSHCWIMWFFLSIRSSLLICQGYKSSVSMLIASCLFILSATEIGLKCLLWYICNFVFCLYVF